MLKQLIQRLLDSRTTPGEAVSANGMDLAHVTDVPWTGEDQMTYVAPSNGYVKLWIQATVNSASNLGCDITVNNHRLIGSSVKTQSMESGLWMKVKKADSIRFTKWGSGNTLQKVIEFIPAIGGGYNHFVRRALPCLRALSNYLLRSFCKANIPTLPISVDRVQQLKINQSLEVANKPSLPRSVVGPCFKSEEKSLQKTIGSGLKTPQGRLAILLTPIVCGNGLRSRYRRVTQLLLTLVSTQGQGTLLSFATNRLNNFVSGGAAC